MRMPRPRIPFSPRLPLSLRAIANPGQSSGPVAAIASAVEAIDAVRPADGRARHQGGAVRPQVRTRRSKAGTAIRVGFLPVKLGSRLLGVSFKLGYKAGGVPVRVSTRVVRIVGWRTVAVFLSGLFLGLLAAPVKGAVLRANLARLAGGARKSSPPPDLADTVTFELAHAPRTWHLAQPTVSVDGAAVTLAGSVPDVAALEELARVAAAIPGVASVANLLTVTPG